MIQPAPAFMKVSGSCLCGRSTYRLKLPGLCEDQAPPVHVSFCHCEDCRKQSGAPFSPYIQTDGAEVTWGGQGLKRVPAKCAGRPGQALERLLCAACLSMMALAPEAGPLELSAGCLDDGDYSDDRAGRAPDEGVLPSSVRFELSERCVDQRARWHHRARPQIKKGWGRTERRVLGSCACGGCRFEIDMPGEIQHCYCRMCRQLSGGALMTWAPARTSRMRWLSDDGLKLRRTSAAASRHGCVKCGTTLSIVYDWQDGTIWPSVGAFDESTLADDPGEDLYRIAHICVKSRPPWYELPEDGLERIDYAC
mmetsp:Transcript_29392/g.72555  ORF Transcript_29392/g.72555 Transcript_29392/m.72555 type:complete len:309 (+) Transcript_29392:66-992(+)